MTIEEIEQLAIDCWRAAQTLSVLDVEHIAANGKTILEARDYLDQALARLRAGQAPK